MRESQVRSVGFSATSYTELDDGTLARVVSPVPRSLGAPTTATKQAQSRTAQSAATTMIELPLDVYLLNLQIMQDTIETYEVAVGRGSKFQRRKVHSVAETIDSGQTEQTVRASIARANEIWKPAEIKFQLNKWISKDIEFDSKVVTEEGFLSLVAALKLEPDRLEHVVRPQVRECAPGGQAVDSLGCGNPGVCRQSDAGKRPAHELGPFARVARSEVRGRVSGKPIQPDVRSPLRWISADSGSDQNCAREARTKIK